MKQRLLGAVILTALLVILVPEWLDGSGHKSRYPGQIEMPPKPPFEPIAEHTPKAPAPSRESPVKAPVPVPAKKTEVPGPVPAPASAPESESSPDAWALQVGSFSEQSNARVMRDRMRAEGYAAYIHAQKTGKNRHYRVRIGPELDRDRIETLKTDIQDKHDIKGLVVKHP